MHILAELSPLDPVTSTRPVLRLSSVQDRTVNGLNSQKWWPGISRKPTRIIHLFDGDFSSTVDLGQCTLDIQMRALEKMNANARRFVWAGASIILYAGDSGQAWPWTIIFDGRVGTFKVDRDTLTVTASVDVEPFKAKILASTYAGTGGIEGGSDIKGKAKPWAFGSPLSIEPILINSVDSVFQVSAYGNIKAVTALYERGSQFGASLGDYADYTALVAASIPAGRWATCLASGLIRLGAPPYGVITADLEGDYQGSIWRRLPGAIIQRMCSALGISGSAINTTSLNALDTAMSALPSGGNIDLYLTEQSDLLEFVQRLALSCNAQAGVSWTGQLFATRVSLSSPTATLDSQMKRLPRVTSAVEVDVSPPYSRLQMGGQKCWRVHTFDEIAFGAELIDRGQYDAATVYRDGNIVSLPEGSRWLFVGAVPFVGSLPSDANANWERMSDPIALPLGTNLVINSDFTTDSNGWFGFQATSFPTGVTWEFGRNIAGIGGDNLNILGAGMHYGSVTPPIDKWMFGPSVPGAEASLSGAKRYGIAVAPGDYVYASALLSVHGGTEGNLVIRWLDSGGTVIQSDFSAQSPVGDARLGAPDGSPAVPASFVPVDLFATAPAGAAYAALSTFGRPIPGGADTSFFIFITQPFFAKVAPGQSVPPPYTSGPADRAATFGAPVGSLVGTSPAATIEAGGNAANNGLDSSGNVLANKVGTTAILDNNITTMPNVVGSTTFFNTSSVVAASVTMTPATGSGKILVLISGTVFLDADNSAGTTCTVGCDVNGSPAIGAITVTQQRGTQVPFSFTAVLNGLSGPQTFDLYAHKSTSGGTQGNISRPMIALIEGIK